MRKAHKLPRVAQISSASKWRNSVVAGHAASVNKQTSASRQDTNKGISIMEYYNDKLCIAARVLLEKGILTKSYYDHLVNCGRIRLSRNGGGRGDYALVEVKSLPLRIKRQVMGLFPSSEVGGLQAWLEKHYEEDYDASCYFLEWRTAHGTRHIGMDKVQEMATNANVLNACLRHYEDASAICQPMGKAIGAAMRKTMRQTKGTGYDWDMMARAVEGLRMKVGHTLPTSVRRFRMKVLQYQEKGYVSLLPPRMGNDNAAKLTAWQEGLLLALSCRKNQPFDKDVQRMYDEWLRGELTLFDPETGEVYAPETHGKDAKGRRWRPSLSCISSYLNRPDHKLQIDKAHKDYMTWYHENMPHHMRKAGEFSLSQLTADDVDLSRKTKNDKIRPKAYYIYDDLSGCVIGQAYSRKKDEDLVEACFRDLFRTLARHGWGMPMGIEVENHLMTQYKDGFLKAGNAFPYVRYCAPQNSQDKYAEAMNGAKKRSVIHKNHEGIGRFYCTSKWRTYRSKVYDGDNDKYDDRQYFDYEQLVAEDRQDTYEWNHSLHPNQKKYPGKTRWQVLAENLNPNLQQLSEATLARYIGEKVETHLRRNSYARAGGEDWWIAPENLEQLRVNNYALEAYYLPTEEGEAERMYFFQDDTYICEGEKAQRYTRPLAERTAKDEAIRLDQDKKLAHFKRYADAHSPMAVDLIAHTPGRLTDQEEEGAQTAGALTAPDLPPPEEAPDFAPTRYSQKDAIKRAIADF